MTLAPHIAELFRRVDLTPTYPPFRDRWVECLSNCYVRGASYYAISAGRSWDEQEILWAKGRRKEADGSWVVVEPDSIVTKAAPGQSLHNYFLAGDNCLDKDATRAGLQPGWMLEDYDVLAEEAEKVGLKSLRRSKVFPEGPHVQLDIARYGILLAELRDLHRRGGSVAVFDFLDAYTW